MSSDRGAPPRSPSSSSPSSGETLKLGTILNVNDHEATRYMVSRMLRMAGFEVLEAATGEEALRLAAREPDLVVLDVKLPDVSGFEVARMLKAGPLTQSIIVLQTSATYVTTQKKVEGLDSGADSYLAHPFEPVELIATVKALLRLRRSEQELRRRADELTDQARRKDEFLAMLAHELRNPLAAISMALPLLELHREAPERHAHVRGVVERQTRHLARLVDDLLDVSRITRGKIDLRKALVDVGAALREAVQVNQAVLNARGQKLHAAIPEEPVYAQADFTRLEQVFTNLLDNASKYSEKGSRIDVTLREELVDGGREAVVVVADEGIGIAREFLPHVFDLFVQADESLHRTRGGMGIGLTLVKRLVELHGGRVGARSDGLGRGSQFEVRLPVAAQARAGADGRGEPGASAPAEEPARTPVRVLIVADDVAARDMLDEMLRIEGHDATVATDGAAAVALARETPFDVALVDLALAATSGYEVAEQLRALPDGRSLYIIALTDGGGDERMRILTAGFDLHLVKPVNSSVLLRTIGTLPQSRSPAR